MAVLFRFFRNEVQSPNGTLERVVEGCRLSGAESPVAYIGDAGEGSPRSDVIVKDVYGVRRTY